MLRNTPRKSPRHRVRTIPKPPPAAMVEAMMAPATKRTIRDSLALITGALVADLVMGQEKSLEEAAEITGFSVVQLRASGLEFAMALTAKLDPDLGALMASETPEDEAAQVARIAENARATARAPHTMI